MSDLPPSQKPRKFGEERHEERATAHAVVAAWPCCGALTLTLIQGRLQEVAQPAKDNVPDAPQPRAD